LADAVDAVISQTRCEKLYLFTYTFDWQLYTDVAKFLTVSSSWFLDQGCTAIC